VLGLGINKVRVDFTWSEIETRAGFDFAKPGFTQFMQDASAANIEVLPILDYGNPIYNTAHPCPNDKCIPDSFTTFNTQNFQAYAQKVATAFPQLTRFEIWNEP